MGHIEKMCKFKHGSKSIHCFEEESTTLPKAEGNADSYSLFIHNDSENVITEDILINAHPLKIEVDTGAALSLVSSECITMLHILTRCSLCRKLL